MRIKRVMVALCVALITIGCQRNDIEHSTINDMVTITIDTDSDDTRTYLNLSAGRIEWSTKDQIGVFENSRYAISKYPTKSSGKAKFDVQFSTDNASTTFTYNAIYPTSSYVQSESIDVENIVLSLPSTQYPTATSFDSKSDILIAKQLVESSQLTRLNMQFKRIVAMAELTIKGLPTDAKISKVQFYAEGRALAGNCTVNLPNGTIIAESYSNVSNEICVEYDESVAATTPMYFNCYPTTLTAGDSFSVTVTLDNGSRYTKSVTLAQDRSLRFEAGDLATFSVDMSSADYKPNKTYQIGDIYDENGVKGVIYAIKTDNHNDTWCYLFSMDEADLQWSTENVWCNCVSQRGDWNTEDMLRFGTSPDKYPAAQWCVAHGEGWFMPSSTELQWMWDAISNGTHNFDNASVAQYNKLLTDNGGMPFVETYYMSSNETADDIIEVIAFMKDSVVCLTSAKSDCYTVRAVYRYKLD